MVEKSHSDEVRDRAAAAIKEADAGSNHQAGTDGDDESAADAAAEHDRASAGKTLSS